MATTTQTLSHYPPKPKSATARTKLVCFSFAAYAKNLIDHLKSLNIPVLPGLTDPEFSTMESTFSFSFPPDLRSILQEGLPFGPHFPNWRSSSPQQLQILKNLPSLNLSKNVLQNNFWVSSWGDRPEENSRVSGMIKKLLDNAPVLVPIYRNCYIPASPSMAGNPVFYVDDEVVRVLSFDIAGFFQELEFLQLGNGVVRPGNLPIRKTVSINVPAWAATAAREIEFWTDVAENGRRVVARAATDGWWIAGEGLKFCLELTDCLEEVFWRLRDGGWREEEVREMLMMDGHDQAKENGSEGEGGAPFEKEEVVWHVTMLSASELLRSGWSREDVVYSLDLEDSEEAIPVPPIGRAASFDIQIAKACSRQRVDRQKKNSKQFMNLHSLEV